MTRKDFDRLISEACRYLEGRADSEGRQAGRAKPFFETPVANVARRAAIRLMGAARCDGLSGCLLCQGH